MSESVSELNSPRTAPDHNAAESSARADHPHQHHAPPGSGAGSALGCSSSSFLHYSTYHPHDEDPHA